MLTSKLEAWKRRALLRQAPLRPHHALSGLLVMQQGSPAKAQRVFIPLLIFHQLLG